MKNRSFIIFSITFFAIIFITLLSLITPTPRKIIDIFLELAFAFQPFVWLFYSKKLFKNQPFTKTLQVGCILFFLGGVFEVLEEAEIDVRFIDDIEDALLLFGMIFITIAVYKIGMVAKKRLDNLSQENKENYIDSIHDSLTNLYNKRYLQGNFTEVFDKNPAIFTSSVCVFIDIDNFKKFNDTFGHEEGDQILSHLGVLISESKRKGDFAFRYGGEEFLIFYMNSNKEFIMQKLEILRRTFKKYCVGKYPDKGFLVSLSIGATVYSYGEELSDIIHRSDKAMYVAKFSGKDRIASL